MKKPIKPPVQFDVGVTVNKQGKPAIDFQFSVPKILNTAASLSADASISSLIAHSLNLRYSIPVSPRSIFLAELVKQVNDYTYASSFSEAVQGFRLSWTHGRNHVVGLDAHLRDVHPMIVGKLSASEQLRRVPLRSIKTSINYKYVRDATERTPHAVGGYKFSFLTDLAGLFGDVRFFKVDSALSMHRRIRGSNVVTHTRIGTGAIAPLGRSQTPVQDRFFLGGTTDENFFFRGFAVRSVGPAGKRIGNSRKGDKSFDHLGGDAYYSIDNAITFPLYSKNELDIRGILFGQIGSVVPTLHSRVAQELVKNTRASVGLGVVVPIGNVGTLELTLGKPVWGATLSDMSQSLQIGIRISNVGP